MKPRDHLGTPYKHDWHFGRFTCASCLALAPRKKKTDIWVTIQYLDHPVKAGDTVLIPQGIHKFHRDCWEKLVAAE